MVRAQRSLTAALLFALAACASSSGDAPDQGRLARVVGVSKQINEMIYDIGAEDHLVARDLTSVYPPEIEKLPSVGYHRALSAEGIISMKPTLLLTDGNMGPDAVISQVKEVGVPVSVMAPGKTLQGAEQLLTNLGKLFHREQAADSVLKAWQAGMQQALADSTRWAGQSKPRVLIMHFGGLANNYLAVNRGSAADQILRWAGGVNAMDSIGGMTRLTPELIAKAAPDVIVATDLGFDRLGSVEKFAAMPGVNLTPAGKNGRIIRVEEGEINYFTPRTPEAIERLAKALHP